MEPQAECVVLIKREFQRVKHAALFADHLSRVFHTLTSLRCVFYRFRFWPKILASVSVGPQPRTPVATTIAVRSADSKNRRKWRYICSPYRKVRRPKCRSPRVSKGDTLKVAFRISPLLTCGPANIGTVEDGDIFVAHIARLRANRNTGGFDDARIAGRTSVFFKKKTEE